MFGPGVKDSNPSRRIECYRHALKEFLPQRVGLAVGFRPLDGHRTGILHSELFHSIASPSSLEFILDNQGGRFFTDFPILAEEGHPHHLFLRMKRKGADSNSILDLLWERLDVGIHYIPSNPNSKNLFFDAASNWKTLYPPVLENIFQTLLPSVQRRVSIEYVTDILLRDSISGDTAIHAAARQYLMPGEPMTSFEFLISPKIVNLMGWPSYQDCRNFKGETPIQVASNMFIKRRLQQDQSAAKTESSSSKKHLSKKK